MGVVLQQLRELLRGHAFGIGQRPRVLGRGFAVSSERRRACARGRRETQHRARVVSRLGVMGKAGKVGGAARRLGEDHKCAPVQGQRAVGADGFGDGNPRQLVAERDARAVGEEHS